MTVEAKARVRETLDRDIRPDLQRDGGDAELVAVTDDGVVQLRLLGHCAGCPFSAMTMAVGVEQVLKEKVPQVTRVEAVP